LPLKRETQSWANAGVLKMSKIERNFLIIIKVSFFGLKIRIKYCI
jgi:hypothetical protein